MEVISAIKERRSIRRFTEENISEEEFKQIVEAARFAPSWKNSQTVRYHVISDRQKLSSVGSKGVLDFSYNTKTILQAPHLVVLTNKINISGMEEDGMPTTSKGSEWEMFDAGIAAQTFCLSAYAYGYGTVIMGIYDEQEVSRILNIPQDEKVAALIAIGHPKFIPNAVPPRLDAETLISFE